jgi:hypothetical protein
LVGSLASPLDLYRTANTLVQQYGPEDAFLMAAKRADALLESGDVDGQRVWEGAGRTRCRDHPYGVTAQTDHGPTIAIVWYSAVIASGWLTPSITDRRHKAISATTPQFGELSCVVAGSAASVIGNILVWVREGNPMSGRFRPM